MVMMVVVMVMYGRNDPDAGSRVVMVVVMMVSNTDINLLSHFRRLP